MLDVRDFGAKGDFATDDRPAIQAAIDACPNGGLVLLPRMDKYYLVKGTLTMKARVGIRLVGEGSGYGTQGGLVWRGPADQPLVLMQGCRSCSLEHLNIVSNPASPLACAVQSESLQGTVSTDNHFLSLKVEGTNLGGLVHGFRIVPGSNGDRNNDLFVFQDCMVSNYSEAAYAIEHMQSCHHSFQNCGFSGGAGNGKHGVRVVAGSFTWLNGAGGNCSEADFHIQQPSRPIRIQSFDGENSARLLTTGGPANYAAPIILDGVRWPGNRIHQDGGMVVYMFRGPLVVRDSQLGAAASTPVMPVIKMKVVGPSTVMITGNVFGRTGSAASNAVQWNVPAHARGIIAGNTYMDQNHNPLPFTERLM